jgi:DNA-binding NtrC family response regulator
MQDNIFALLVHDHTGPFKELEGMLEDMSVETWNVETCNSAGDLASQYKPNLMFIELPVWDRLNKQLAGLAKKTDQALNIVVVGTKVNIDLYASSLEQGAVGYIAAPFAPDRLNSIVRSAAMNAHTHRAAMAQTMAV